MLQEIRKWLNGSRDYIQGVRLLIQLNADEQLLNVLREGPNPYRLRRVEKEILNAYDYYSANDITDKNNTSLPRTLHARAKTRTTEPVNEELYNSCRREADLLYKKVMNDRAVLFSMANEDDFLNPNMQDKINRRQQLAIDVVVNFRKVSVLYDRASYVFKTGRLPEVNDTQNGEYDAIPPELVKQVLDNARKALNKLKKKKQTPERIALMQKHQTNIKKLEAKWAALQAINQ